MKIKVKEIIEGCFPVRTNGKSSDAFDLFLAEDITLKKGQTGMIGLGVVMKLPKGMIARVYSRSSSPIKAGVSLANGLGFIDTAYSGDKDEWKAILYAHKAVTLTKGTRVCQFEIAPSQFATRWQKVKWMLSSKVKLIKVNNLDSTNRGGVGSTGK